MNLTRLFRSLAVAIGGWLQVPRRRYGAGTVIDDRGVAMKHSAAPGARDWGEAYERYVGRWSRCVVQRFVQ